jgi:hypothetical protein
VKKCSYCAEDIQDAAIVCKHCGRELQGANAGAVTVRRKPRDWQRPFGIVIGSLALLWMIGWVGRQLDARPSTVENRHVSGECQLTASMTAPRHDALYYSDSALGVKNGDGAAWDDAELRIYGNTVSGPYKGPSGIFKLRRSRAPRRHYVFKQLLSRGTSTGMTGSFPSRILDTRPALLPKSPDRVCQDTSRWFRRHCRVPRSLCTSVRARAVVNAAHDGEGRVGSIASTMPGGFKLICDTCSDR